MKNRVILVYHGIGTNDPYMEVQIDNFKKQILYLASLYKIVSVHEILTSERDERLATIMFDDAHISSLEAMLFLEKEELVYEIAVVEEFIGKHGYCDLEQLLKLRKAGFLFHTKSHKNLTELSNNSLKNEISSDGFNQMLKYQKGILVYPRGIYNKYVIEALRKNGFYAALTVLPFHLPKKVNLFEVPRLCINGYLSFNRFRFYLSRYGNIYLHLAFAKRNLLGQNYLDK